MSQYTIALDAMGGDHAPGAVVEGVALALSQTDAVFGVSTKFLLIGQQEALDAEITKHALPLDRVTVLHAPEVIENHETPTHAVRRKKDSSMMVGLRAVRDGQAHAFISAGSTGALLAGATVIIGRKPGIERPALGTLLPNRKGHTFLIDCGANIDAKPSYLVQFAQMGSDYTAKTLGIARPRVGLINIGAEEEKGNQLCKEAFPLLAASGLNFVGNVEAREVPAGAVDVAVCDAFVGNVLLKYTEGLALGLMGMVKDQLMADPISKFGALLSKRAYMRLKNTFDYENVGGAPFLGLKALVVKAHGSSGPRAICAAIHQCTQYLA